MRTSDVSDWKALSAATPQNRDLCVQAQDNQRFTMLAAENQTGLDYNARASVLANNSPLQGDVYVLSAKGNALTRRDVFDIRSALKTSVFVSENEPLRVARKYKTIGRAKARSCVV